MPTTREWAAAHGTETPTGSGHGLKNDLPVAEADPSGNLRDIIIDTSSFGIRLADTEEGRNRASLLINKMYAWRGYVSGHRIEPHPNRITLAASDKGNVIGTVTLGIDSPSGILADEVFRDHADALRAQGAHLCEITKLAFDHTVRSKLALAALFHTLFIYGYHIHRCTHALIEVNPRHRRFYEHMLGFHRVGEMRENPRVKAPAYLLSIALDEMARRIREQGGTADDAARVSQRSLYPFFFSRREEAGILHRLQSMA
jgi:hypothetical protein